MRTLLEIRLKHERDALAVRQTARHVAQLLGFEHHDQIRIATAVSELVRAALGGDDEVLVELLVTPRTLPQRLVVRVTGAQLAKEPNGQDGPHRGDGKTGAQRLLERFEEAAGRPDTVALARALPSSAPTVGAKRVREIREAVERIDSAATESYLTELKQQNRELSSTLYELERKQEELTRLNTELADTNRGVMALYAELDERANHLRRADEIKTKFLSNMTHEFRTPLNSIRTLSHLLLDQADGPLNQEQLRQVQLIHGAAAEMLELVNDLLDLARVEAGKITLNVGQFTVGSLFGVLRGMMRPLLRAPSVSLEFEEDDDVPAMVSDEGKVAQVLRNILSNAVKFTEEGSIRVGVEHLPAGARIPGSADVAAVESVLFCVMDTGVGISPEDQEFIFDEFTQVRNELQPKVSGTGLGLPLCRKLSTLLGGRVWVESELGAGSRFYLLIPRFFRPGEPLMLEPAPAELPEADWPKLPLLVISEIDGHRRRLENIFDGTILTPVYVGCDSITADYLSALRPEAVVLDVSSAHSKPPQLVETIAAAGIPTVRISDPVRDDGCVPIDDALVGVVYRQTACAVAGRVLIVDDDERFRSVLLKYTQPHCPNAYATGDPRAALEAALSGGADCIVLDLLMPDLDGLTLLTLLRDKPATADLPVLACSSKTLSGHEHRLLTKLRAPFLSKNELCTESLLKGLVEARAWSLVPAPRSIWPREAAR